MPSDKPTVIRLQKKVSTSQQLAPEREAIVIKLMSNYLEHTQLLTGGTALVNSLAHQFQCERASLGLIKNKHVRLITISGNHQFDHRTHLARKIEAAMNEMLDQKAIIALPDRRTVDLKITQAHQSLSTEHGLHAVCSIPLINNQQVIGAITLEGKDAAPIDTNTIQICNSLGKLLGPVMDLKHQDERHTLQKIISVVYEQFQSITGSGYLKKKIVLVTIFVLIAFLSLVNGGFRITTEAVLEGSIQRVLSAPVAGYLAAVHVRPGDEVNTGQIMGTMDDRDLKLEQLKQQSLLQQLLREYREVLAKRDLIQVNIFKAKMDQSRAEIQLIEKQLERMQITAPFKGIVIEGDLDQQLGSPIERGQILFKIAPLDGYRIIFKVDESDVSYIKTGQAGQLVLTSLPDNELSLTVSTITPISIAEGGRNYFRVEARLDHPNTELRPGMAGVGKIHIGERKLGWLMTYRILNRIRLWLWTILP